MVATDVLPAEYCGSQGTVKFAGIHLIVELWQAKHMTNIAEADSIFREAIDACGATLLNINLHEFTGGGYSGAAILAESHISIHTWPEYEYAAMDIFVCGTLDPYKAVEVMKARYEPKNIQVVEVKRGIM